LVTLFHRPTLLAGIGSDSAFPGPADFNGGYESRGADATEGAQSTYDGSIVATTLARSLVARVLPDGFALASRKNGGDQHPVMYLVGHQREPLRLHNGATEPIPDAHPYQEMMLIVPFVARDAGDQWHTFVVRMYLDDAGAIAIGNSVYAYAKDLADLYQTGAPEHVATQVTPALRPIHFGSDVMLTGSWRSSYDAETSLPRWRDLQSIFEMPILGVDSVRNVCSYWEWNYAHAEVAPATSRHRFYQPFRAGMDDWVALGPLSSAPDGAVAVRGLRWRLALPPPPCRF
jgi:hypothetical protein